MPLPIQSHAEASWEQAHSSRSCDTLLCLAELRYVRMALSHESYCIQYALFFFSKVYKKMPCPCEARPPVKRTIVVRDPFTLQTVYKRVTLAPAKPSGNKRQSAVSFGFISVPDRAGRRRG